MSVIDDIYATVLRGAPRLDGAACVGHHETMDEYDDPGIILAAKAICDQCGARAACREFVESLPPTHRPFGTTAGELRRPPRPRQRKESA